MIRLARRETIDPNEVVVAHICNRTVRKCFLMGQDESSGKNFDHRKLWIEQYLKQFREHGFAGVTWLRRGQTRVSGLGGSDSHEVGERV